MNRIVVTRLLLCGLVAATTAGAAFADFRTATLKAGDPLKVGKVNLCAYDENGKKIEGKECWVEITTADLSAARKAAKIAKDCTVFDFDISVPGELTLINLNPAIRGIWFWTGTTEEVDGIRSQDVQTTEQPAKVAFENTRFDPFDVHGQPAIFTAGIVTDVGELTARVSSEELNFQTEGPIICQALYEWLAPRAPQYGAQINYAGDRLEIYFDPAYTVTQGGVIFGTTSPSPGCSGLLPLKAPFQKGDLNCDGVVDFGDIDPFVLALSDPAAYQQQYPNCDILAGDCNDDGNVDFGDIDPFVAILSGG